MAQLAMCLFHSLSGVRSNWKSLFTWRSQGCWNVLVPFGILKWTLGNLWLVERVLFIIKLGLRKHPWLDKTIFWVAVRWRFDGFFPIHQDFFWK